MTELVMTDAYRFTPEQLEKIEKLGYHIRIKEKERKIPFNEEELTCEVLVHNSAFPLNRIEDFKNLKFMQGYSAGTDDNPVEEMRKRGILYSNARGVFSVPMAEFIVMRILEIYKKSRSFDKLQAEKKWYRQRGLLDLKGKTAGLLGTGDIAQETAKRFQAFDMEIIGFNRSKKTVPYIDTVYSIEELLKKAAMCDVIVSILPLNEQSRGLLGEAFFDSMKEDSIFINVGRGKTVKEEALVKALKSGKLRAAALDVFEEEPLSPNSPLWEEENFYYSPHNSGESESNTEYLFPLIYENLKAYKNGTKRKNVIL